MSGTISILGAGSGLQLQDILDQLKEADSAPITLKEAKKVQVEDRISEFDKVKEMLLNQKSNALSLSLSTTYLKRSTSLSSSVPASVSVADGVTNGSYSVEVASLAQKSAWRLEQGYSSANSYVNSSGFTKTFTYKYDDETYTLSVNSGTTLQQLASMINGDSSNPGVTASVTQDGSGSTSYKLLLQSDTIGEAGRISDVQFVDSVRSNEEFSIGYMSVKTDDKDWTSNLPSVSGTWTGQADTEDGTWTYTFTANTTGDKTIGTDEITLDYTSILGSGSITIPSSYQSGDKVTGPNGMELSFNVGDVISNGKYFKVDAKTDAITTGDFKYSVTTPDSTTRNGSLTIAAGTTLQELVDQINNDPLNTGDTKVTAKLIDGSGSGKYKLSIEPDTFKADLEITQSVSGLTFPSLPANQTFEEITGDGTSLDAEIKIDGVSYTKGTNQITDVLDGVTFSLQATGQTNLTISTDTSYVKDYLLDFVEKYNEYITEYNENNDYDMETRVGESLHGVSSLQTFTSELTQSIMSIIKTNGEITSLFDLGLEANDDGTLSIDETTLQDNLDDNFDDVKTFLYGDSDNNITGWGDTVNSKLRTATMANSGLIAAEKTAAQNLVEQYLQQIEDAQSRLDKKYEIMAKQFQELDKYMSSMQSMSSYMTSQFKSSSSSDT